MAEVKWIKITTNMFDDEKIRLIESMPDKDAILIIWIKLLVQAGKTNASGYIYLNENIPYTEEMLATLFNRPISTVRLALKTFQDFGMIEITDKGIYVTNWEKHQNIDGLEKIREQTRKRVAKHREKKKLLESGNVTVTLRNATDLEEDLEEDKDKESNISEITKSEREILNILRSIENYPFDYKKDLDMLRTFMLDYPDLDLIFEFKKWRDYKRDRPLQKNSSPRSQLRNWMNNAVKFKKKVKAPAPDKREPTENELYMAEFEKKLKRLRGEG